MNGIMASTTMSQGLMDLAMETQERIDQLATEVARLRSLVMQAAEGGVNTVSIDVLARGTRSEIERLCRAGTRAVPMGDNRLLCRVLTRYLMYVDPRDTSLAPHMAMNGYWETWITQAVARHVKPGMRAIDVGANFGYYALFLADVVGERGYVWVMEPNPNIHGHLAQSMILNGYAARSTVSGSAADDADGRMLTLRVPAGGADYCSASMAVDPAQKFKDTAIAEFPCTTTRLDTLVGEGTAIDFMKIDAEGAEERVWRGMEGILARSPSLTVTMEFERANFADARGFLERIVSAGFSLGYVDFDSNIKPVTVEALAREERWWMLWLSRGGR